MSGRSIDYVILPTLIDYDLSKLEIFPVVEDIIKRSPFKLNDFVQNALKSCHLFTSGYPRVSEQFYEWMKMEENQKGLNIRIENGS
jgi:hypothetical protein